MDRLLESAEVFFITHVKSNHPTLDSPFQASKFDNVRDYGFLPIRTTKNQIDSYFVQILQFFVPLWCSLFPIHTRQICTCEMATTIAQITESAENKRGAIMEWTRWSVNHHGVIINNRQQKRCAKSSECPLFLHLSTIVNLIRILFFRVGFDSIRIAIVRIQRTLLTYEYDSRGFYLKFQ